VPTIRALVSAIRRDAVATDARRWTVNLAIFRVVLLGLGALPFAWRTLQWTEHVLPGLPRDAWRPVSFYAYLPLDVLADARLARWLVLADLAMIALALVGVFTRWTCAAAAILSLYVFGLAQNQGKVDHCHHLVWFMALVAAGPSDRVLSVDAFVATFRRRDRGLASPTSALATLRCVWILFGLLYLGPGMAKLASAITDGWASEANLRRIVWLQWLWRSLYQPEFVPWRWVDAAPAWVVVGSGLAVIAFESSFILLVLIRRVRPWLAAGGLVFHLMNGLVLGIWFAFLIPAYAALIDWVALGRALARHRSPDQRTDVGSGRRTVLAVGGVLIAAQLVATMAGTSSPASAIGSWWPFDAYPTFSSPRPAEAIVWEARALLRSATEQRISPGAWAQAFGSPARCRSATADILDIGDPARRHARSRATVERLWRHEAIEVRSQSIAVAVYEVHYALGPTPQVASERLLDRFAAESLAP
jgi:hypothetical protein